MPSTVPEVVSDLVDLLEGLQGVGEPFEDVLVRYGAPIVVPKENDDRIYVLDPANYARNRGEQNLLYETFNLRVIVECFVPEDNPSDALERKWELIEALDAALASSGFYGYDNEGGDFTEEPALFVLDGGYIATSNLLFPVGERG